MSTNLFRDLLGGVVAGGAGAIGAAIPSGLDGLRQQQFGQQGFQQHLNAMAQQQQANPFRALEEGRRAWVESQLRDVDPPEPTALEWLDQRVSEMCVRL